MNAEIHTLYESGFYRLLDFRCRCTECTTSKPEYSDSFTISFVRKGNFLFNVFRRSLDSYTGCVLVTKPGYERTVTHTHAVPDECSIFEFRRDFFPELLEQYGRTSFFTNNDLHSTLVKTTPETEYLHYHIVRLALTRSGSRLEIDHCVMQVIQKVLGIAADYRPDERITVSYKKNHLQTIERAKEYITEHFAEDISLAEIARYCYVSPFHFSRIFKTFTEVSPHRFLLQVRLQHAALLLKNSAGPVGDIAFASGFNSIEHFTAAFRQRYNMPPLQYRQRPVLS